MASFVEALCGKLKSVAADPEKFLPLHEPTFIGNEQKYVADAVSSTFVSSVGKFVDEFENQIQKYTGCGYAIAVTNGTVALQLALELCGVKRGDEVLVPSLSFVATANAVSHHGAIAHFVDCEEEHFSVCPDALSNFLNEVGEKRGGFLYNKQSGRRISALILMHCFGHVKDPQAIMKICFDYNLQLIEDAAEALGSFFEGHHAGTFGKIGTFSFNGNKTITTGGGGMIVTSDPNVAKLCKHLSTTAKVPHRWEYVHDMVGYNFRMPNINAALGCAQLEQIEGLIKNKRLLFEKYYNALNATLGVKLLNEPQGCRSNFWLQTMLLEGDTISLRDDILEFTNSNGCMTRPCWKPMHLLEPYKNHPRAKLEVTEKVWLEILNIPSGASLI